MEGDTTNFYIYRQISDYNITTSTIARGISVGDDLEYAEKHINEILSSKERLNEYVGECKFSGLYYR